VTWRVKPAGGVRGAVEVPGDKSITHRAFLFGALARGETVVRRPLDAGDTGRTLEAVEALGVKVLRREARGAGTSGIYLAEVRILGSGFGALSQPRATLDMGNSGTSTRLLLGVLAGCPVRATLDGDASLRRRPMLRVVDPLRLMGASIEGRSGGDHLPLAVRGGPLVGIEHRSPVASAQVKSCLLLAGLQARGTTVLSEPSLSRDHSERMLAAMGALIARDGLTLSLAGGQELSPVDLTVPGDLSSAAFFLVAAAITPGSEVIVRGVGVNPTRTGILDLLSAMGAEVAMVPGPDEGGEPVADVRVRGGELRGVEIPPEWVPRLIDELPVAAVAAAFARGRTVVAGARELRSKESDRIDTTVQMLRSAGVKAEATEDGFAVEGSAGGSAGPAHYQSHGDHRLAMASAVLALRATGPSQIDGTACVATSFPGFPLLLGRLAPGSIEVADGR
jgi:3-phosphoshikimate 1-carboxyvinyltransferase